MPPTRFLGRFRSSLFCLPGIQTRVILWFACAATVLVVLQFLLFSHALTDALEAPVEDVAELHRRVSDGYVWVLVQSLGIALPVIFGIGLLATFPLVGPLRRVLNYLRAVRDGGETGECTLRRGDELEELCELVNDVTRSQREGQRRAAA